MVGLDATQIYAVIIFFVTIAIIISGIIDRTVVAFFGVILMIIFGVMDEVQAFMFVDWNVICILIGIWIIAGYFSKSGIPEMLAIKSLKISGGNPATFIIMLGVFSALISMFVDNVVVVLMMSPLILHVTRRLNLNPVPFILFIALCANFMGTALLLGDLPPQMLHSVSGIEFLEFIWQFGRPSSFPLLLITLIAVILFFWLRFKRMFSGKFVFSKFEDESANIKDKRFAFIVCLMFIVTVFAMSLRQVLNVALGFIAISGAVLLSLILEILAGRINKPSFEKILAELDWRAIFFYILLFSMVGGIKHVGIIKMFADFLFPWLGKNVLVGVTVLYWFTAAACSIVEHDAYILTFLYIIKDLAFHHGIEPWPYYWALVWAGTLGSNATIAGAPALYVALNICEKEEGKIPLKTFFSYSIPFVAISLVVCYILTLIFWVLPYLA